MKTTSLCSINFPFTDRTYPSFCLSRLLRPYLYQISTLKVIDAQAYVKICITSKIYIFILIITTNCPFCESSKCSKTLYIMLQFKKMYLLIIQRRLCYVLLGCTSIISLSAYKSINQPCCNFLNCALLDIVSLCDGIIRSVVFGTFKNLIRLVA